VLFDVDLRVKLGFLEITDSSLSYLSQELRTSGTLNRLNEYVTVKMANKKKGKDNLKV
jgi:hypothetical protein